MAFANRAELETSLIGWLGERTDLIPKVPDFIALCEEMLNGQLRSREQHERALAILNEEYEWLPDNFAAVDYLAVGSGNGDRIRVPYKTMTQLDDQGLANSTTSELPCAFSIIGKQIRFAPVPTALVVPPDVDPDLQPALCRHFEIVYWAKVSPLTAPTSTNAILLNYPSTYLYGALVAAEPYLVNDPRVQMWADQYGAAIDRANTMDRAGSVATPTVSPAEYAP